MTPDKLNMEDLRLIVVSTTWPGTWGKGKTLKDALKNAEKPKAYKVFLATKDTYVSEMGYLSFPQDYPPQEIHEVPQRRNPCKSVSGVPPQ